MKIYYKKYVLKKDIDEIRNIIESIKGTYQMDLNDEELMNTKCTYENVAKVVIRNLNVILQLLKTDGK